MIDQLHASDPVRPGDQQWRHQQHAQSIGNEQRRECATDVNSVAIVENQGAQVRAYHVDHADRSREQGHKQCQRVAAFLELNLCPFQRPPARGQLKHVDRTSRGRIRQPRHPGLQRAQHVGCEDRDELQPAGTLGCDKPQAQRKSFRQPDREWRLARRDQDARLT